MLWIKSLPSPPQLSIEYPTGHCEGRAKKIREGLGRVFWDANERKIRKSLCSTLQPHLYSGNPYSVEFSPKIQMSKKPLVVKTYGRHKYRTVKAQTWLSPDETFLSPFGRARDQTRFPSKFESASSKNNFKPKPSKW